jgi:hypothetical protein
VSDGLTVRLTIAQAKAVQAIVQQAADSADEPAVNGLFARAAARFDDGWAKREARIENRRLLREIPRDEGPYF